MNDGIESAASMLPTIDHIIPHLVGRERIAITGAAGGGKTTLAEGLSVELGHPIKCTDELRELPWSEQSEVAARWLGSRGPFIIEGTTVARGLRKALRIDPGAIESHPISLPEVVLVLPNALPGHEGSSRRKAMSSGVITIMGSILPILKLYGTRVLWF